MAHAPQLPCVTVRFVNYGNPRDAVALVELLDGYAREVAGRGRTPAG